MYYVYALFYKNCKRIYIGITEDINKRIKYHKRGKTRSTKNRGEFEAKIIERCQNRATARKREKYWKSGCGKEKLKRYYSGVEQFCLSADKLPSSGGSPACR